MYLPRGEIAGFVFLEIEAVDDNRRRRLVLIVALGAGQRVVEHDERETGAIRRPVVVDHVALELGELLRIAAAAIEEPELIRPILLAPVREESEIAAVRAPAGRVLAVGALRELDGLLSVPARHPKIRGALVASDVGRPH